MNKRAIQSIASNAGTVIEVDEGEGGNFWGRFARVRVSLKLSNPLKKCVSVRVENQADEVIILLVYERLPDFCYLCGRIGHVLKECEATEGNSENLPFGSWLKASTHITGKKNREEGRASPRSSPVGSSSSIRSTGKSGELLKRDSHSPDNDPHNSTGIASEPRNITTSGIPEPSKNSHILVHNEKCIEVSKSVFNEKSAEVSPVLDMMQDNIDDPQDLPLPISLQEGIDLEKIQSSTMMSQVEDKPGLIYSSERRPNKWRRLDRRGCPTESSIDLISPLVASSKRQAEANLSTVVVRVVG
ncbi:cellular nucleic acid-binding protein [Striga asiatica]|uniref:Cellular nucleic acid-binding protein n=1 Tax=Striga asiatica TaxID=4170 RepID=A0A5A7Q953_STRAF|nr:cellular nucleic acid-binding protein [Striga asiatica]